MNIEATTYREEKRFCYYCSRLAKYYGKFRYATWGYMCEKHFKMFGWGLGNRKGWKIKYLADIRAERK